MRTAEEILTELRSLANADNAAGMARFGITGEEVLGISLPRLRATARDLKRERKGDPEGLHVLAADLWASGVHEARILASLADVPALVTPEQMDAWAADLDSWDVCDQLCNSLLWHTPYAHDKAVEWAAREETFVKRAAFALIAVIAWHDKAAMFERIAGYLLIIEREATDERPMVKKAVNWALRQIGKRDLALNAAAIESAERIAAQGSKAARCVAADALRELRSDAVRARLGG
jgi:3-methyladenine DNA glycosylase AlkD